MGYISGELEWYQFPPQSWYLPPSELVVDGEGDAYASANLYLGKLSKRGTWEWIHHHSFYYFDIALDSSGHLYACGTGLQYDSEVGLTNTWQFSKFDRSGNAVWNNLMNVPVSLRTSDLITTPEGEILIAGTTGHAMKFGSISLADSPLANDWFIVKYDPSGNALWARSHGDSDYEASPKIALDAAGHIYLGGNVLGNTAPHLTEMMVSKFDPEGHWLWDQNTSSNNCYLSDLVVDPSGNILASGWNESDAQFGLLPMERAGAFVARVPSDYSDHQPPTVLTHPRKQTAAFGNPVTISANALGPNLQYQWRKNGLPIDGANSPELTIPSVSSTDAGYYSLLVSNEDGAVSTLDARVIPVPTSILPPSPSHLANLKTNGYPLTVALEPGRTYRLQTSIDLQDWLTLATFTDTSSLIEFLDTSATNRTRAFYRVISP
ncbi:MAG: immunoglobulin domain-containing protein [Verrucomicrobiota bacterium]